MKFKVILNYIESYELVLRDECKALNFWSFGALGAEFCMD